MPTGHLLKGSGLFLDQFFLTFLELVLGFCHGVSFPVGSRIDNIADNREGISTGIIAV
jgi:hypothetical protein